MIKDLADVYILLSTRENEVHQRESQQKQRFNRKRDKTFKDI